ncbi:ABC transporter permease subunit [Nesterenkonia salmonea]|uniref:ABC transporter permease subunit n=1 Tax=Nesterenkonia salmonea TaxID=1804987 RepID=A0A5R9BD30_9MICC|nr:ABC transporter permease subunit [Nesterenkonia salmonea]TLP98151.1 ABC transporter permease subunit [Nesterenkonia salmonea]
MSSLTSANDVAATRRRATGGSARKSLQLPGWVSGLVGLATLLTAWWLVAVLRIFPVAGGGSAVPTPLEVVARLFEDGVAFYWRNLSVTLTEAGIGFTVGNLLAIFTAALVLLAPWMEKVATQLAVITYCLPLVAIGPVIFAVAGAPPIGEPSMTANVLAGLSVYFVTVITTIQGLRAADQACIDVITVAGGGRRKQLTKVQLITSVPYILTALKIAAPAAILGAILGEYVGGVDRGLGPAMVSAQETLNVARLWALALVGAAAAGAAYAVLALITRFATPWSKGGA